MGDKTPIRRDENLLVKAKAIFGEDLVTDAFVCTWFVEGVCKPTEVTIRLNCEMHRSKELDSKRLSYDAQRIRLVFCNGKVVDFDNSEWASISNPDGESYEA